MIYKKTLVVPVFTATLVSSKEPSNEDLSNNEISTGSGIKNTKSFKKHGICFGDPMINIEIARKSRSCVKKSNSTLSILRLKPSYIRFRCLKSHYLRLCVSKSPSSRYLKSRSPSWSPITSCSVSPRTGSPLSRSTYTVSDVKSSHTSSTGHRSASIASFVSTSAFSDSVPSRPNSATYFKRKRSPVSKPQCKSLPRSPISRPTCLKFETRSHPSRSPPSKPCLKSPNVTHPTSKSSAPRPSCLKSLLKLSRSKSPIPRKSCLRSTTSKSPDPVLPIFKPSCFRTPTSKSLNSKPSPVKHSCLKSPVSTINKKSSNHRPNYSRIETSYTRSPKTSPTRKFSNSVLQTKSLQSKSPCRKSVSFKSTDLKSPKSRSPISINIQPKTPKPSSVSTKASSNKTTDSGTVQSRIPRYYLPDKSIPALRSRFFRSPCARPAYMTSPRLSSPPPPIQTDFRMRQRTPLSKDTTIPDVKSENLRESNRKHYPRLTVSKIRISRLSLKMSRRLRRATLRSRDQGQRPSQSLVKLDDYKSVKQESPPKLTGDAKANPNRDYFEKLLATSMDVHYMVDLKNYFDKLKMSLAQSINGCNSIECEAMRERLRQHREEHHGGHPPPPPDQMCNEDCPAKGMGAQTKLTLATLGGLSINLESMPVSKISTICPDCERDPGYGAKSGYEPKHVYQEASGFPGPGYGGPGIAARPANERPPGFEGKPGYDGSDGLTARPANQKPPGFEGKPGYDGSDGLTARPANQRPPGFEGKPGYDGSDGLTARPANQRPPGFEGKPGYDWSDGLTARPANQRPPGFEGKPGYDGSEGFTARPANQRPPGFEGKPGYDGSSGLTGTGYEGSSTKRPGYDSGRGHQGRGGYQGGPGYQGSSGNQIGPGIQGANYQGGPGNKERPVYQGTTGNQGGPVYQRSGGYQAGPGKQGSAGYQGGPGNQGSTGNQRGPGNQEEPVYQVSGGNEGGPGKQGSAGYQRGPANQEEPVYQGYGGNEGGPGKQRSAGYQAGPGKQGSAGNQGGPGNQGGIGYQGRPGGPGYQSGPDNKIGLDSKPGFKQELSDGSDFEQRPGNKQRPDTKEEPAFKQRPGDKQRPGNTQRPDTKEEPAFKQGPGDKQRPGNTQRPDTKEEPAFKQGPGDKQGSGSKGLRYEENPIIKQEPTYKERPEIKREPANEKEPNIKQELAYEEEPGITRGPSDRYKNTGNNDANFGYKESPGYQGGTGYEDESAYKGETGYAREPGHISNNNNDDANAGYEQNEASNYANDRPPPNISLKSCSKRNCPFKEQKCKILKKRYCPGLEDPCRRQSDLNNRQDICPRKKPSYIVDNPKYDRNLPEITSGIPLRDTTYDLSYGPYANDCTGTCNSDKFNVCISDPALKCTVISRDVCGCPIVQNEVKHNANCGQRISYMEREIKDWLKRTPFMKCNGLISRQQVVDALIFHINSYLHQPSTSLNKSVLKAKIINVLRGLGICGYSSGGTKILVNKLTDDLANKLIGIATRLEFARHDTSWNCYIKSTKLFKHEDPVYIGPNQVNREDLMYDLMQEIEYSLRDLKLENNRQVLETIAALIIDKIDLIRRGIHKPMQSYIKTILENNYALTDDEITIGVNNIMNTAREIIIMISNINDRNKTSNKARTSRSGTLSIYTSEHEMPSFAAAGRSTPKKKKDVSKLSPEEKAYSDKITTVLREWIKTKPAHFENLNDSKMNEVMIADLAGEIVDHVKLGQLISSIDTKSIMTYYIYKWLLKFEILDDMEQAEPHVQELVKKLEAISAPPLTRSQHGTRQTMKNIKYMETEEGWTEPFVPKAQDILEDEISIWMNEYPSEIYVNENKSVQNKLVHEFAEKLQKLKGDKKSEPDVSKEIKTWLKKVVKSKEKERIDSMSESLKERISKLPHDKSIKAKVDKKLAEKIENRREVAEPIPESRQNETQEENDNTMKEFIVKYVEHNYDEEDPLAKGAYAKLLKLELERLSPQILQEVYTGKPLEDFSPQKLFVELGYIKDISDWLKTLPVEHNFNKVGNKRRIDFIICLARDIAHVENERLQAPDAMNYDEYIGTVVCQYMHQLPLKIKYGESISKLIHPLLIKIFGKREENMPSLPHQEWHDVAEFLDDYVKLNGQDIADDEVKLEVWATRLLQEIKKMIAENPSSLPLEDVHDRLAAISKPGDETIKRFNHELDYAKEISDWLKNFPLTGHVDEEMIRDLAEKMAEYETATDDSDLVNYVKQWILKLPLDKNRQIDIPLVIQQLINRRNKVMKVKEPVILPTVTNSSISSRKSKDAKTQCRGCCPVDDPGYITVQVIKDWCDELPLRGSEEDVKQARDEIASKLYQKIIEINHDPRLARNDMLYIESLSDKIDVLFANLPKNVKLEGDENKLKSNLLKTLRQAKLFIQEVSLGEEYVQALEDAVESAFPKPLPLAGIDPGFEIYKENLAEMFVLENFDHGTDADKLRYKKKIKDKVDKTSVHAQQRKHTSLPADKFNNDTLGILFNVSMPVEKAMSDNVEIIKTKCEIENWAEKLPLQPASGPAEQLERDKKLDVLARKLHILEFEKNPDQKIHKEITKWLSKEPMMQGQEANIDRFANDLQEILKNSQKSRKVVKASDVVLPTTTEENSIWVNPNNTIDNRRNIQNQSRHKTSDILIDLVEKWCDGIPLPPNLTKDETQKLKNDVTTRIIKKISELNSGRNTFNDDKLYNHLMNQEIEKALNALPQSDRLMQSKNALIHQLSSAIESVKPLIREDRARHEYKTEIENTVGSFLGTLENATPEEQALFSNIQEEIVDNFIEHQYNKDDDEAKEFFKNKMLNALTKYNFIGEKEENRDEIISDTLVETNHLLCELLKITQPEDLALKDEVEEIRMKKEVDNFLNKVSSPAQASKSIRRNSIRNSLAKQLHEIEKTGHTDTNNQKMSAAVSRTLKKLNVDAEDDKIKTFIDKLEKNESIRKAPAYNKHAGNYSLPANLEDKAQNTDMYTPYAISLPISPSMYESEYIKSFVPPVQRQPAPPSPSKALKYLMDYPPQDSVSLDQHVIHQQVDASVHRPDYIPPQWVPPKPPPNQDFEVPLNIPSPRQVPVEIPSQQYGQLTQSPSQRQGGTQTNLIPPVAQHGLQVPSSYSRPSVRNFGPPQAENFGQTQAPYRQPINAGVQSNQRQIPEGEGLTGDECLCEMCNKNPCEVFDYYDSCDDDLFPRFRRPMMFPPCLMMPPPYMY